MNICVEEDKFGKQLQKQCWNLENTRKRWAEEKRIKKRMSLSREGKTKQKSTSGKGEDR